MGVRRQSHTMSQLDTCAKFALRWLDAQRATKNFRCQAQMHSQVRGTVLTLPDSVVTSGEKCGIVVTCGY